MWIAELVYLVTYHTRILINAGLKQKLNAAISRQKHK